MFGFSLCREDQNHSLWTLLLNDVFATPVSPFLVQAFWLCASETDIEKRFAFFVLAQVHPLIGRQDRAPSGTKNIRILWLL